MRSFEHFPVFYFNLRFALGMLVKRTAK
jgi:hypothetical protein